MVGWASSPVFRVTDGRGRPSHLSPGHYALSLSPFAFCHCVHTILAELHKMNLRRYSVENTKALEAAIWEGRARIMWGDSPDKVADWMRQQGVPQQQIDDVIRVCMKERDTEIRRKGMRDLLIGSGIMGVSTAAGAALIASGARPRLFGACLLGALYGFFRLTRGLFWLLRGGKTRGSLASLDDEIL